MDVSVCADMGFSHIREGSDDRCHRLFLRRPFAPQKTVGAIDVRLVDGNIIADDISKGFYCLFHKGKKYLGRILMLERAHILKPQRVCEMVERQKRLNPLREHIFYLLAIVLYSLLGVNSPLRLDPAPLDTETVYLKPHIRHKVDILLEANVMIVGANGSRAVLDLSLCGKSRPVVVFVTALDLSRRRSRTQKNALFKLKLHRALPLRRSLCSLLSPLLQGRKVSRRTSSRLS